MNNTEKILAELERIASEHFDYWTEYKGKKTKVINLDAREAVKDLINQVVAGERKRMVKYVNKTLDRYVVKKEPLCEQNSLILLIRAHLLSSLDTNLK